MKKYTIWKDIPVLSSALERTITGHCVIGYCYTRSKYEAKRRGIPFDLSKPYYALIWRDDCTVCGVKISMQNMADKMYDFRLSRSLDRIDPKFGYVEGNVQFLCVGCNSSKSASEKDESPFRNTRRNYGRSQKNSRAA